MFHVSPGLRVEAVRGHPQRRSLGSEDGHVRVADAPSGAIQGGRRNPTPSGRPLPAGGMPFTVSSPNRDSDTSGGYNLGGSGLVHLSPMPSRFVQFCQPLARLPLTRFTLSVIRKLQCNVFVGHLKIVLAVRQLRLART